MAREVHPPRIYESPLPFSRSSQTQTQPSTTRAPLGLSSGFLSNTNPQALDLDLAKTLLTGKKINKTTKKSSLTLSEKREKKGKGKEASSAGGGEEEASDDGDDGGFGNLTRESSKDLPGSAMKMKKSGGSRKKVSGGGLGGSTSRRSGGGKGKGLGAGRLMSPPSSQGARGGGEEEVVGEKSVDLVVQMQPYSYIPPTPPSSQPLPTSTISTTPSYSPGRRAPSLPAPASPSFLFPSSSQRRAISQAPPPKSPLKALTTSRSRKRTVSSGLGGNGATSTTPAPSPNPRARKQPKSTTLSASSSQPLPRTTAFTLSTPVASSSGSKRAPPRTDRPIASKPSASFPFISSSSQPNLSTSRKKSTLPQSTSSSSYNRRKSAPARGLSVTADHPDEGTPLGSQTLPDTPPPPRSPGDDPILLKGRERVRRYEYEEGDESVLMGDEEGVDELDMMMGESSQRERSVKTEEEMGDLSMQRSSMGGGAEDDEDEEGEDANITYNPQASPSTSRTRSSLVAGRRSSRPSPPPPAPVAIQQPLFLPTTTTNTASSSSLARPSPLSLFLTTASSSSSSAHSTPLLQRTVASSSSSSLLPIQPTPSSTQHQTPHFPPSGYTPSLLNPYTPAPALSPYTFHQPGTPESYSGSEDDHEERMLNRERSDSFLAEMIDGEAGGEGWARKMRSSLSPDSSDHEEGQGWGGEEGMDFGRDDGDGEVRWRDEEEEVVVEREKSLELEEEVEKIVEHQEEHEEEQQEPVASQSQPRPSFANLDRSSPVCIAEHDEEEAQVEPSSIPVLALAQDDKEPSAAPEDADASPPPSDDGHDEQQDQPEQTSFEQDQDSSFLVMVEQKSLAEEIAEAETPEQSPVEEKRFDLQRGGEEDEEDSFSENDHDHDASFAGGFDSDSFGGSQHDEEEEEIEEEQWEDEGDAMDEDEDEDEAEELYFNESSQDLLDAAEHSFLSTVISPSPSPIKSVHMSSPAKLSDRSHLQPIASSSTPARLRRSASPHASSSTPFLSNLPTIQQLADNEADVTQDYVVELNDVSSHQSQSDEEEALEEADHSFVSTASIVDSPSPSITQQRPSLGPKRLSLQSITQLDALFKNRSSLSPSLASGGSPSPRFAAFPSNSNSTYFPIASSSTTASVSSSHRRPSVSSSTGGGGGGSAYPSISDAMAAKQEILAKAFEKRSAGESQQGEVLRVVGGSGGGGGEEGEGAEETYIKISSNDPREAARATAFLKMFHDYVETDLNSSNNPNASFTSASSSRRKSISKHQTSRRTSTSSRRRSSIHMGDVSMMSAPELLMEAEQEIADELDEDASSSPSDEEEELAIPGSFQSSSMLSLEERSFVKEEKKKSKKGKGKGKGRESVKLTTRDRAWGTTEWRCLMGCLDAVGGKRGEVDEEVVVGRFLETMGLMEEELEGEWDRSKLLTRIASIQQRRLNELKTGGTPGRRRRSHNNPQRAFLSPNKASNMSIGSITSTHSPRRPTSRNLPSSSSLSALPSKKPTFAGKLFGFLSGGWLAPSASVPNVLVVEDRQQEKKKQHKETVRPQPPSSARQQAVEMAEVPRVRLSQPNPAGSSRLPTTNNAIPASPIPLPSSSSWRPSPSSNVDLPSRSRPSSSLSHPPPPPTITIPTLPTSQRAPIAIPQRPTTAPIKIKPRSSNVMSPKPKVLEMVRSFESVRSLGEEEMERVRALERKGSRGSLRSVGRGGEEED